MLEVDNIFHIYISSSFTVIGTEPRFRPVPLSQKNCGRWLKSLITVQKFLRCFEVRKTYMRVVKISIPFIWKKIKELDPSWLPLPRVQQISPQSSDPGQTPSTHLRVVSFSLSGSNPHLQISSHVRHLMAKATADPSSSFSSRSAMKDAASHVTARNAWALVYRLEFH
jgi:hypothetical protein